MLCWHITNIEPTLFFRYSWYILNIHQAIFCQTIGKIDFVNTNNPSYIQLVCFTSKLFSGNTITHFWLNHILVIHSSILYYSTRNINVYFHNMFVIKYLYFIK